MLLILWVHICLERLNRFCGIYKCFDDHMTNDSTFEVYAKIQEWHQIVTCKIGSSRRKSGSSSYHSKIPRNANRGLVQRIREKNIAKQFSVASFWKES